MNSGDLARYAYEWHRKQDDAHLNDLLNHIRKIYDPSPDNVCHWCGKTDTENDDEGYGPLLDIRVRVAEGEEGDSDVFRYACNQHMNEVNRALVAAGFGMHAHGGICYLEVTDCPGAAGGLTWKTDCPSPESQFGDGE